MAKRTGSTPQQYLTSKIKHCTGAFRHSVNTPGEGQGEEGGLQRCYHPESQRGEKKIKLQNATTVRRPASGSFKCNATAVARHKTLGISSY